MKWATHLSAVVNLPCFRLSAIVNWASSCHCKFGMFLTVNVFPSKVETHQCNNYRMAEYFLEKYFLEKYSAILIVF